VHAHVCVHVFTCALHGNVLLVWLWQGKKERLLCKHRESNNLVDQINMDLTYSVCFNLANAVRHQAIRCSLIVGVIILRVRKGQALPQAWDGMQVT
jgi:hypothetical protein